MAELLNITHDANNLNEYDSTVTDSGDLSTGTPGLAGTTARMEAFIDDTTSIYGRKSISSHATNDLRFRAYIDPNTLTFDTNDELYFIGILVSGDPFWCIRVELQWDGSSFEIRTQTEKDDSSTADGAYIDITDDVHYVEIHLKRASSNVAADGETKMWIDGALVSTVSNIDNYDLFPNISNVQVGAFSIDAGTSGTLYLDEIVVRDDDTEIGPVPAGGLSIPVAMHYYRMRRSHGATGG